MGNGANATRWELYNPEIRTPEEAGTIGETWVDGVWDEPWNHGTGTVEIASNAAKGQTQVSLTTARWGHDLLPGDWLGFIPSIFSAHVITEVVAPGTYRIEPPLRAAIEAGVHSAILTPRLALRAIPQTPNYGTFNPAFASGRSVQLIEAFDEYIITNYEDEVA